MSQFIWNDGGLFIIFIFLNNNMSTGSVKDILKDKKKVRFVAESAFKQVDKDGIDSHEYSKGVAI